jgi:hypothetical protein
LRRTDGSLSARLPLSAPPKQALRVPLDRRRGLTVEEGRADRRHLHGHHVHLHPALPLYDQVLRHQCESLALGYVVLESCLIAVGIASLLAVVTLRRDLAGAAGTDHASLILSGRSLVAVHGATFLLGPAFRAAIGNGLYSAT